MNRNGKTLSNLIRDTRGQALPWVTVMLVVIMGVAGFVVDLGHAMVCERLLQTSTNSAAMAAALQLPASTYSTYAHDYGSETGQGANVSPILPSVTMTVRGYCSSTVASWGVACLTPSGDNAVEVTQTAAIPTTFARVLGITTVNISASATASERGSPRAPFNVAVVIDTTQSMTDQDGSSNCSGTRVYCAMQGIQDLLKDFSPCYTGLSSCNNQTAVDEVSIFTFPPTSTPSYDTTCPHSGSFNVSSYPDATNLTTTNLISAYEITGMSNNYRASDGTSTLTSTSPLVIASGATNSSCGLKAQGGVGTYYAGAINAAQAYLTASTRTGADNIMIILSDGDASGSVSMSNGSGKSKVSVSDTVSFSASNSYLNWNGTYPSPLDMCQQGIDEATAAKTAGTKIYVVAYGAADTSSGYCQTDTPKLNPCTVLQDLSGDNKGGGAIKYFFADGSSTSNGCTPPTGGQTSFTTLTSIFSAIATDLEIARLIPNGTT
jgi:Putative Flp pilus-assembly TadE/G-like